MSALRFLTDVIKRNVYYYCSLNYSHLPLLVPTATLSAAVLLNVDYPRCPPHIVVGVSQTGDHNSSNDNNIRVSGKPNKELSVINCHTDLSIYLAVYLSICL